MVNNLLEIKIIFPIFHQIPNWVLDLTKVECGGRSQNHKHPGGI